MASPMSGATERSSPHTILRRHLALLPWTIHMITIPADRSKDGWISKEDSNCSYGIKYRGSCGMGLGSAPSAMWSLTARTSNRGARNPKLRGKILSPAKHNNLTRNGLHRITVSAIRSMMECICAFLQIWIILSPGKGIFQRFTVQRTSCSWNWKRIRLPVQVSALWDRGNILSAQARPYIYGKTVSLRS